MRIGILGAGQLGRMIALAGIPLGMKSTVLDPSADPCAALICPHIRGEFDELQALFQLTQAADVITYEFENVPVESARWLAERVPVFPPPEALKTSQDRLIEKSFFRQLGIPTPAFQAVDSLADLQHAIATIGMPAVLKTRRFGYDGKGQAVIRTGQDADAAWQKLAGRALIFEEFVAFERELSIIAVRDRFGEMACYPLIENWHIDGILHRSIAPADTLNEELNERAQEFAERILKELNYVGVLTIEWFQSGSRLIANEMAPRVHNSGHWTIEGAMTSQFENHLRAIAGLPMGSTSPRGTSVMYNFIGNLGSISEVLAEPTAHFHDYGKPARAGRKVGHVTLAAVDQVALQAMLPSWEEKFMRRSFRDTPD